MKERLNQKILRIDPRVKEGYYTDVYFNRTKEILERDKHHPILKMQIFQRNDDACLCGIDEAVCIIRESLGKNFKKLKIKALNDGDIINAWETIMTIEGDYSLFAHLETVYLGALARGTKVATNVYRCVIAANGKPVLFFPARFDSYLIQAKDGYSYKVGRSTATFPVHEPAGGVSTDAQGEWWGSKGLGTVPHALIAAYHTFSYSHNYHEQTIKAALKFAMYMDPKIKRVVLVDFHNNCVDTTLAVADAMFRLYRRDKDKRYKLFGVRLDTSGTMVDRSVRENMDENEYLGSFKPAGVNPQLVKNVHDALKTRAMNYPKGSFARKFYEDIGIVVSGGFTPEKIKRFEKLKLPVSAYGVGSSLFGGNFDFTADIVQKYWNRAWWHNAKKGRKFNFNPRLREVK